VTRRLTPLELAHEAGLEPAVVDRVIATGGCIPIATIVGDPALDPTLPVHAAVAAGRVVRHEGDVFRTAVNPAARLLSSAGPGEVLVEEGVVVAVRRGTASFEPVGRVPLRSFPVPVAVWRALPPT
jgi:class 3 adenylate cyclase